MWSETTAVACPVLTVALFPLAHIFVLRETQGLIGTDGICQTVLPDTDASIVTRIQRKKQKRRFPEAIDLPALQASCSYLTEISDQSSLSRTDSRVPVAQTPVIITSDMHTSDQMVHELIRKATAVQCMYTGCPCCIHKQSSRQQINKISCHRSKTCCLDRTCESDCMERPSNTITCAHATALRLRYLIYSHAPT